MWAFLFYHLDLKSNTKKAIALTIWKWSSLDQLSHPSRHNHSESSMDLRLRWDRQVCNMYWKSQKKRVTKEKFSWFRSVGQEVLLVFPRKHFHCQWRWIFSRSLRSFRENKIASWFCLCVSRSFLYFLLNHPLGKSCHFTLINAYRKRTSMIFFCSLKVEEAI